MKPSNAQRSKHGKARGPLPKTQNANPRSSRGFQRRKSIVFARSTFISNTSMRRSKRWVCSRVALSELVRDLDLRPRFHTYLSITITTRRKSKESDCSFVSQRFDRIEVGSSIGWVETEADPDC